jgi:hypothetical protein
MGRVSFGGPPWGSHPVVATSSSALYTGCDLQIVVEYTNENFNLLNLCSCAANSTCRVSEKGTAYLFASRKQRSVFSANQAQTDSTFYEHSKKEF